MRQGAIRVDDVSRRFRVHGREARTLKDLLVQRGRTEPEDVWALRPHRAGHSSQIERQLHRKGSRP